MTLRRPHALLALALLTALLPAPSAVGSVRPAASSAPSDAYEAGAGDDTTATARPLAPASMGSAAHEETHTFDVADVAGGDQDWFSFDVSDVQADAGWVVLIEAIAEEPGVRPVIEVYAPGAPDPVDPSTVPGTTDGAATAGATGSFWPEGAAATVEFPPSSAYPGPSATYLVRVRPFYVDGVSGYGDGAGAYRLRLKFGLVTRLAGAHRAATAARISEERFAEGTTTAGAVVVANGWSFADALAGSTLAGALECPLLLTSPAELSPATATEVARLGARTAYVLGGTRAVSAAVVGDLAALGVAARRIAGATRYDTAAAVAREADSVLGTGGVAPLAFLVSGRGFADALSASAPAAHACAPVLLTDSAGLSPAAAAALADPGLGITDVVIVGGTMAMSASVEQSVRAMKGDAHVTRVAGATRYATSREVAVWATANRSGTGFVGTSGTPDAIPALGFPRVGIASGRTFPDALGGGVFCGLAGAPILLTEPDRVSPHIYAGFDPGDGVDPGEDYLDASLLGRSYLFGGSAALSEQVHLAADLITRPPF